MRTLIVGGKEIGVSDWQVFQLGIGGQAPEAAAAEALEAARRGNPILTFGQVSFRSESAMDGGTPFRVKGEAQNYIVLSNYIGGQVVARAS